jgi:hypothetical protein
MQHLYKRTVPPLLAMLWDQHLPQPRVALLTVLLQQLLAVMLLPQLPKAMLLLQLLALQLQVRVTGVEAVLLQTQQLQGRAFVMLLLLLRRWLQQQLLLALQAAAVVAVQLLLQHLLTLMQLATAAKTDGNY